MSSALSPTPTREAILDAAARFLAQRGPGVTLEEIADEAGYRGKPCTCISARGPAC
ncbi:MAG: TetR/AcrR family transcriptional regulator [Acidimicrobiia bacterium]